MAAIASLERRSGKDRRHSKIKARFPLLDANETLVTRDRRRIKDRRITQLYVEDPNLQNTPAVDRLFLWCRDKIHEIGEGDPEQEFWLGRSASCNEQFPSRYVSRRHAKVIVKGQHFILRDNSCNGTYIKTSDHEHYLHRDQIILVGSGTISLGIPFTHSNDDIIYFFRS